MATLSVASVERIIVGRLEAILSAAGLSVVTNGANETLNDPILVGLQRVDVYPSDLTSVTDDDVAGVASSRNLEFLDYVELATLEKIWGNLPDVDTSITSKSEAKGQLPDRIQRRITEKVAYIQKTYVVTGGGGTLVAGSARLNFEQKLGRRR